MKSTRIKALFQLIDFLYSNIGYYNEFNQSVIELKNLSAEIDRLKNSNNFFDKAKVKQLQADAERIISEIETNVTDKILTKAAELNLYDTLEPVSIWNLNIHEISVFEDDTSIDISELIIYRDKFSEFKQQKIFSYFNQNKKLELFEKILIRLFANFSEPQQTGRADFKKLTKKLSIEQQKNLFSVLTNENLLSKDSDFDSFCFVFGGDRMPDNFKPLKWLANRQLLRELLVRFENTDNKIPTAKYTLPPYFVNKKDKCITELPNDRPKDLRIEHYLEKFSESSNN